MVASCVMFQAPADPVPGAEHCLEPSANEALPTSSEDCISVGPVESEQAVMTREAMMALAMPRVRRIIGESPELRDGVLPRGVEARYRAYLKAVASLSRTLAVSWRARRGDGERSVMIELRTLGALELRGCDPEGVAALVSQPKRLGLLAYLAIATPRGFHRRDSLLALFWPESDQTHARGALRNALSFLRHQLGEAVIVTRGDEVGLDPATFWCDVTAFLACADAKTPGEALALYRGDLLEGFHVADAPDFEGWLEGERDHLRGRAAEAAWALAVIEERAGKWAGAAGYARRAVALSPDYEQPACRLIELLDRAGDRGAALREYQTLEGRLAQDLEMTPSPETRSVIDGIRTRATPHSPNSKPPPATHPAPADQFTTAGELAPPRRSSVAVRRWGAAIGVAVLAAAGILLSRSRPASPTDPNLLAIAPPTHAAALCACRRGPDARW
jgi:DNA-binding SARP family transcriptional activator